MAKYIDADLLRKEIEKERKSIDGLFTEGDNSFYDGQDDAYNHTLALIDSLQQEQPENGLDVTEFCEPINQGIAKCIADHWWEMLDGKDAEEKQPEMDFEQELYKHFGQVKDFTLGMQIGKYFYELGKNSK